MTIGLTKASRCETTSPAFKTSWLYLVVRGNEHFNKTFDCGLETVWFQSKTWLNKSKSINTWKTSSWVVMYSLKGFVEHVKYCIYIGEIQYCLRVYKNLSIYILPIDFECDANIPTNSLWCLLYIFIMVIKYWRFLL